MRDLKYYALEIADAAGRSLLRAVAEQPKASKMSEAGGPAYECGTRGSARNEAGIRLKRRQASVSVGRYIFVPLEYALVDATSLHLVSPLLPPSTK